jgi:hypothetical protein
MAFNLADESRGGTWVCETFRRAPPFRFLIKAIASPGTDFVCYQFMTRKISARKVRPHSAVSPKLLGQIFLRLAFSAPQR